ncbi:MAG TPA: gamma carbonic anhydrase family protein [Chloroflexi bacterium]|nr:gamma carbonic anhydrase family protein [Chloroflexota bacterium]
MDIVHHPELIHRSVYFAPNATIVGQVHVAREASIWFGCVLRGDNAPIVVGERTNVQDLTVIHTDAGHPCTVGSQVTIGHRAVLHGATIEDGALIGIGAIVLNGAVVGAEALVGAGALVTGGTVIPPRHLALGAPARVIRELTDAEIQHTYETVKHYCHQAQAFLEQGKEIQGVDYRTASPK